MNLKRDLTNESSPNNYLLNSKRTILKLHIYLYNEERQIDEINSTKIKI